MQSPLDFVSPPELEWELGSYPELTDWCSTYLGRRGGRYVLFFTPLRFATGSIHSQLGLFAQPVLGHAWSDRAPLARTAIWSVCNAA